MPAEETNFQRWRKRLDHARRIWIEKGILGRGQPSTMRQLMEFYRSDQWRHAPNYLGLAKEELRIVNKIFPAANAQQAELVARNPTAQYFARAKKWERAAPLVKALHNYDIIEQNHVTQMNAAFRDAQFAPFGHIRSGYTPEEELETEATTRNRARRMDLYRPAAEDRPWIRRVAPWDVLADPFCERFHPDGGMRWLAYRSVMTRQNVKANPNIKIANAVIDKAAGNISRDWDDMRDASLRNHENPDGKNDFEVWTVYEAEERTWFQMTLEGGPEQFLREPADWPIPWESLPGHFFQVNHQIDTPFAISLLEPLIPFQHELNQLRTLTYKGVLTGRPMNVVSKAAFQDDEVMDKLERGEVNEFIPADTSDARSAINRIQTGGIPNGSLESMGLVTEDIREATGQSRMDNARRVNVETAQEASQIQSGSDIHTSRIQGEFESFMREVEQTYMQGRRTILATRDGANVEVKVLGEDVAGNLGEWKEVSNEDLAGDFAFQIEVGSTRRRDEALEAQKALADIQVAQSMGPEGPADMAELWRRYALARGLDPNEVTLDASRKEQDIRRQQGILDTVRGEGGGSGGTSGGVTPLAPQTVAALGGGQ